MADSKRYVNLAVERDLCSELREYKMKHQAGIGRGISWGEFFLFLAEEVLTEPPVLAEPRPEYVRLGQDDPHIARMDDSEGPAIPEVRFKASPSDDPLVIQVREMVEQIVEEWRQSNLLELSDNSVERIARRLRQLMQEDDPK